MDRYDLEISKHLGQPINTQLKVPFALSAIANIATAEPGEKVYRFTAMDGTADVVLDVNTSTGAITVVKRDPVGDAELTFKGLNSKLEYVLVDTVIGSADLQTLARRKASITRGMDKREVKIILDAILAKTADYLPGVNPAEVTVASGKDLYDMIIDAKHAIEDYGDNYTLLVGSSVKEAIDNYDKANASTFNYNVTLTKKLAELGIEVIQVFGKVADDTGETEDALMDAKKFILIAKDSTIAEGKPIWFVRRRISPEIAQLMGADVSEAERAIMVNQVPTINAGTNTLAYGVYGYESVIFAITNPKAICICDLTSLI